MRVPRPTSSSSWAQTFYPPFMVVTLPSVLLVKSSKKVTPRPSDQTTCSWLHCRQSYQGQVDQWEPLGSH
jgi:hypothetical protein